MMKTFKNRFGEVVTKWESNKHPDNPNFMQVVFWTIWEKTDGRVLVGYHLGEPSNTKFIYGMTTSEAIQKFS